jgi:hypothetical protein
MATYRCPAHDYVFETTTDSRPPGSIAKGNLPAHPRFNSQPGHPDCERCQAEPKPSTSIGAGSNAGARKIG